MTTAYQMPLFCRWDLLVEFDWHRRLAEERFFAVQSEGTAAAECIDAAMSYSEICPLELTTRRHRLVVEPSGVRASTSEQLFCYTAHHQISGDEQLWQMNPGIEDRFPDGETFRCDLILAIFACTFEEAEDRFRRDLQRIQELIAWQSRRISEFHDSIPGYLEARLKCTTKQPSHCH